MSNKKESGAIPFSADRFDNKTDTELYDIRCDPDRNEHEVLIDLEDMTPYTALPSKRTVHYINEDVRQVTRGMFLYPVSPGRWVGVKDWVEA